MLRSFLTILTNIGEFYPENTRREAKASRREEKMRKVTRKYTKNAKGVTQ